MSTLSARIRDVDVASLARLSGVAPRTIYRIRQDPSYSPLLRTAEALDAALATIARGKRRRARAA